MTQKQERLIFKALGYIIMSLRPHADFEEIIKELKFEINKCGKPDCGNGGEHVHPV